MTSESKILTVSYGTFSCTLEGFDNPFDTMKAIAEYFRDLSAQDRHFGAEPPQPDAAMLHRLAEREVSRMVASGQRDEGALLPPETPAPDAGSPRIHLNASARRPAPRAETSAPLDEEQGIAAEPSLTDVIPDGVAAKLARIRGAVHPAASLATRDADPELTAAASVSAFAVDGTAEDLLDLPPIEDLDTPVEPVDETAAEGADELAAIAAPDGDARDVIARLGALIEDTDAATDGQPNDSWHAESPTGTAADLPMATEATPEAAEAAFAEDVAENDEAALADRASVADDLSLATDLWLSDEPSVTEAASIAEDLTAADDLQPMAEVEALATDGVADADDLADLVRLDTVETLGGPAKSAEDAFDEASLVAALADDLPEAAPADLDLSEALLEDPLPEAGAAATDDIAAEVAERPEVVAEAPVATGRSGARTKRVSSRIVRIHADEAAPRDPAATRMLTSKDEADEVARLMQQADEVMAEDENRRRHEALSRLKAAVAATEADRADIDYEAPKADANLDPYRDDLAEAILPTEDEVPAPAPEVKPRRKSVTIRPQEPRPGTIRPGMISPPPLVLVSEQRVDRVTAAPVAAPPAAPAAPMAAPGIGTAPTAPSDGQPMVALRTGRLSGAIGAGAAVSGSAMPTRNLVLEKPSYGPAGDSDEDEDLSEDVREIDEAALAAFVETVGARSTEEMMEAAAAFATCVENRSQFTRPQLMRRTMASAAGKQVSREDGLRSFGKLLRTERIEKVGRGHYTLSETSPYLAEARRLS